MSETTTETVTRYKSSMIHRSSERDDLNEGCVSDSRNVYDGYPYPIDAATPEQFIKEVAELFDVPVDEVEVNVCDEPGRVEVSRTERLDGEVPTDEEREQWKEGKLELWYMTYTVYCERTETTRHKFVE